MSGKPAPWTVESSRMAYSDRFLRHRIDRCVTERGNVIDPYHVLDFNEWCMVVALTGSGDLVLVEEYRHAAGQVIRGLPSGTVEAGEDPAVAMPRELKEETGYGGGTWIALPPIWPNPATASNTCHCYLALGAERTGTQTLDPGETIEVLAVDPAATVTELMEGRWKANGLHVANLLMAREHARAHLADNPIAAKLIGR
ncbi:MAG: NUDIX hydrolase [Alphaproteobacteria bacterium]|nr:NUDIX hydrolase [Alphaproteobacteria bacterium]